MHRVIKRSPAPTNGLLGMMMYPIASLQAGLSAAQDHRSRFKDLSPVLTLHCGD